MRCCRWIWGLVLAVSSGLILGCGSTTANHRAAKANGSPSAASRDQPSAVSEDKLAAAHAHFGAGVIHDMNDDSEAALEEYYQAALNDPGNELLVLEVSRRFLQSKQPDKALEIVSRAASRPEASGQVYARLGLVYSQLGKHEQAVVASRTAIRKSPDSLAGYQNLFVTYLQTKRENEALKVLDEAAKQSNVDAEFLISLGEMYVNFGMQVPAQKKPAAAKALAVLNRADKLSPGGVPVRMMLADTFSLAGDSGKAARIYLELLKKLPEVSLIRGRVHAKLTDIYLRSQDRQHATEQLQAIIKEDPTNPQAYYVLGSLAFDDKKPAEAAEYFSKAVMLNPEAEQPYYDLATAQINLNKGSEALATLEQARKRFPQSFVMEFLTGMAFSRQKAYPQALEHYTAAEVVARASDPKRLNEFFYFQVGATYERKGDYPEAEKYFQKCLQLAPEFAEALNYLGYMWAEHGLKLQEARDLIQKALKAEPKNAAYLDSMGWVLFKLNQPQEALGYVLKAAELSEEPDPTLFDHLGDIYMRLSQPVKARESWQKSLSLEQNEEVRKKLGIAQNPIGSENRNSALEVTPK